ncbi:glycosyltransferase family 4 protein [Sphingobacterium lumbrici]|uniref:glycosyltransferase family 4 protein n=1 Tax=Sphingobacterium lumbrici TaxID=2559600 RepID=UPI0011274B81|nr:glycosyltransferase family 4 protein [Sphingobacterium lumbrici]
MKILMICDFYGIGQQYQDNMMAKYYHLSGHEVHIVSSTFGNIFDYINDNYDGAVKSYIETDLYATIYRTRYVVKYKDILKVFENIKGRIENILPDLIYFHGVSFNMHQAIPYLKRNSSARMIMDYHADYSNIGQSWKSVHLLHGVFRKYYLKKYLSYLSKIYPIVPNSAKFLNEIYGIPMERMKVLPLGYDEVEAERIKEAVSRSEIREKLGVRSNDFLIVSGGKFTREKRTELLLKAVNSLNDPRIHLVLFGKSSSEDDQYEKELQAIANDNTHFLGWLNSEKTLTYMYAADMAVFPASQSVMWQQCIGMDLPLIVGNSGEQDPSYLNQYDNMVILDKDDIDADEIARQLKKILDEPAVYAKMKLGATKMAQEYLKYSAICMTTIKDVFG